MAVFDKAEVFGSVRNPNLFNERFISRDGPAWHQLGKVVKEPLTATEGMVLARANYEVAKVQLEAQAWGRHVQTEAYGLIRQPLPDDDEARYFGTVTGQYRVVQNSEIAALVDPLTERGASGSMYFPLETVGSLGQGERVFWCLDGGDFEVRGDLVRHYVTVVNTFTGSNGIRWMLTPVRTECQNTLAIGMATASMQVVLPHKLSVKQDLSFYLDLTKQLMKGRENVKTVFDYMAISRLVDEQVAEILEYVYPTPKMPSKVQAVEGVDRDQLSQDQQAQIERAMNAWQREREQINLSRTQSKALYLELSDMRPSIGETRWALYNGIVEWEDYRKGAQSVRDAAESALFGARYQTKARAFDVVLAARD